MKRTIIEHEGWGPTAFAVQLTPQITLDTFLGEGWIIDRSKSPMPDDLFGYNALDLFLDLQREGRTGQC